MTTMVTILNNGTSTNWVTVTTVDTENDTVNYALTPGTSITAMPLDGLQSVSIAVTPPPPTTGGP